MESGVVTKTPTVQIQAIKKNPLHGLRTSRVDNVITLRLIWNKASEIHANTDKA